MDGIIAMPAALKLALTLLAVVSLMRLRAPIGGALFVGVGLLGVLFPMAWDAFLWAVGRGLVGEKSLLVMFVVTTIMCFSGSLDRCGQIKRIIDAFRAAIGESRLALIAFPSLLGLLPMPGGAVFSAPMVKEAARDSDISPERLAAANYWFRHIWEFWYPIFPGVILALTLTDVRTGKFILMQIALTPVAVLGGYWAILRGVRIGSGRRQRVAWVNAKRFLIELLPILIVVATVAVVDPLAEAISQRSRNESLLARRTPVFLGLLFGMAWLFPYRGLTWRMVGQSLWRKTTLDLVFVVAGIMAFQEVLGSCGAVVAMRDEFLAWHVPLVAVICALPFIAGLIVGIGIGFVGASFPLVIALVTASVPEAERLPYYCLAYSIGYVGMMMSPVHLCLVLSNEYFKASLGRVYRLLTAASAIVAAVAGLLFLLFRAL